jgi:hypothetical protein
MKIQIGGLPGHPWGTVEDTPTGLAYAAEPEMPEEILREIIEAFALRKTRAVQWCGGERMRNSWLVSAT